MANATPPLSRATSLTLVATVVLASIVSGCSTADHQAAPSLSAMTAPTLDFRPSLAGQGAYPLAVGNRWRYAVHSTLRRIDAQGTAVISEWDAEQLDVITGMTRVGDHDYFVLQSTWSMNGFSGTSSLLLRQDRSGLFELLQPNASSSVSPVPGLVLVDGPDRAAVTTALARLVERTQRLVMAARRSGGLGGGPVGDELTLLRYPLHVGTSWSMGGDTRTVVGRSRVSTPAGDFVVWRVRSETSTTDARDRIEFAYGTPGYAGSRIHTEDDVQGQPAGTLVMDSDQLLTEVELH